MVRVESPQVSVTLRQTIARNQDGKSARYVGAGKTYDLAGFLTEDSSVTCSRAINAPAGSFSITVGDRGIWHDGAMDSLYGLVEPMDVIEIRAAGRPHEYGGRLPLLFRGIVSDVRRDESVGQDGRPRRTVTIAGQDFGKILQMIQIRFIKGNPLGEDWLSEMVMQTHYDIQYNILEAGDLVRQFVEKIANKFIENLGDPAYQPFAVDVSGADPADKVMPQGYQAQPNGTLWSFLQTFGDLGPFYELMLRDEEDGPKLIYRKPPFWTADGELVYGLTPGVVNLQPEDVVRLEVGRSDADVANWYWIDHPRVAALKGQDLVWLGMGSNPYGAFHSHPNCHRDLYGIRTMEVTSNHGHMNAGGGRDVVEADLKNFAEYNTRKTERLRFANQDNVVFESGSMTARLSERIQPGEMVRVQRGKMVNHYYANRVTHSMSPFRSFTTSVSFSRGTGFVNRSSNDALGISSPYLEEAGNGVY